MLISHRWLQRYFKEKLPSPERVAEALTFSAFEIEGSEARDGDTVLDVKVLPDRAHYALCHRGIAREVGAALRVPVLFPAAAQNVTHRLATLSITIEDSALCRRYVCRRIEGVFVGESPEEVQKLLRAIGQKPINSIVDAANFVMFDMGEPLHAFDADKVRGGIVIRPAKAGEGITTLDGKNITLNPAVLIIADDEGPLALAGIKGGMRAEVTKDTKNILLEGANFDPVSVRKTSQALGIKTDASKRFENEITPSWAAQGVEQLTARILALSPGAKAGEVVDKYPTPQNERTISVPLSFISHALGFSVSEGEALGVLERLTLPVRTKGDALLVAVPPERLDLTIPEDIVEEIGRLIGYDKVPEALLPKSAAPIPIHKQFYWENKIRAFLVSQGFSEVMTPSFVPRGDVAIEKPLASDKAYLRKQLAAHIERALACNLTNAPLLGTGQVKIFEVGRVFPWKGEHTALGIGIAQEKGASRERVNDQIKKVRDGLRDFLGIPLSAVCKADDSGGVLLLSGKEIGSINNVDGVLELDLGALTAALPEPTEWDVELPPVAVGKRFMPFSIYPFIVRDIAFFVPEGVSEADAERELREFLHKEAAGIIARGPDLFDRFEKGGKLSLAFRIVFQSFDRTLTDDEVNAVMEKITASLASLNWHIR